MAIKAAPKGDKNAFRVSFGRDSGILTVKSFLRHIGWNASEKQGLATTWNAEEKMFEAALPPQHLASSSAEPKKRIKAP
jgi:hypothetical protein